MKRALKILIFLSVLLAGLFSLRSAQATTCQLTNVWTGVQTVVVGQVFAVTVNGQNCANQDVTVNVYGQGGTGQFLIKSAAFRFPATTPAVSGNITILASDITGRTGNITASLEAVTSDSSSRISPTSIFIIQAQVAGSCQLSSAQWQANFTASPILDSPLHMIVNGAGCTGFQVSYEVYDYTAVSHDAHVGHVTGQFNTAGTTADAIWDASGRDITTDQDRTVGGTYQFYFIAAAGSSSVTSSKFPIPTYSETGCLNCSIYGTPVNNVSCADGTTIPGLSTFTGARNACQNHIGDALGGTGGGGGGGGGGGTCGGTGQSACQPGASQSYFFSIPNPLKGGASDLASLVKVIAQWVFNLAIPIAVAMIVYAGVLFLTAQGSEQKVTKAKDVLKWAVVGLAIILIGSGFITLIQSILELGSDNVPGPGEPAPPDYGPPTPGVVGNKCDNDRDCLSVLKCKNTICQRPTGNLEREPCKSGANCDVSFICDQTGEASVVIDDQILGTCSQMSDSEPE